MTWLSLFCYFQYIYCVLSMAEESMCLLEYCSLIMLCQRRMGTSYILHAVESFIIYAVLNLTIQGLVHGLIDKTFHWLILMSILWLSLNTLLTTPFWNEKQTDVFNPYFFNENA